MQHHREQNYPEYLRAGYGNGCRCKVQVHIAWPSQMVVGL